MITIGMNYKVLPGKEENFERMFKNVLHSLQSVAGHGKSALYNDVTDRQSYLIVSEWDSEDAFHIFIGSEKFRSVVDWGQENILADKPVHTVYK
jgi:heme-degrading monooxygenase HmoA